jgi:hypothetical protein
LSVAFPCSPDKVLTAVAAADDGTGNWDGLCHIGDGTPTCCNTAQMSPSQMTTYKRGVRRDSLFVPEPH